MGTLVKFTSETLGTLSVLLRKNGPGPIVDVEEVRNALSAAWDECVGSDQTEMAAYKATRATSMEWNPPRLTFLIERHGGAALGSSRAEKQRWTIDLGARTADVVTGGYRQLRPNTPAFDAAAAARGIALAVSAGAVRPGLAWKSPESVRIVLSTFMPPGPTRTTEGRRKRLQAALDVEMARSGWTRTGSVYVRTQRP